MRCPACSAQNPEGLRFCEDCGTPLSVACANCGADLSPGKRFCGYCGVSVVGAEEARVAFATRTDSNFAPSEAREQPPDEASTEVRHVSVLFCDLVGFTPLSESRDPEEVRELLSGYFDLARAIVSRTGGVIQKFIGDAVMAVWGAPVAREDDAERAVRAGLELVVAVSVYGKDRGVDLACRVGVATGEAATTETAEEGLVIGDRVNTAARIQAAAPAGSCYVDSLSRRLSVSAIGFEDAGHHELKGKSTPEQLFRAVRVLSGVGGKQRSDSLEAPLVGRDTELRALKDLFHLSVERQSPRLVVIAGPAGVGKTRLGWEFYKYIDGLVDTTLWHSGRCLSYGEGVAFWALAEIVRQRLGIAEEDSLEVAAGKLHEGVVRFVAEKERGYVEARLARLLGVELSGERAALPREELFAGWRLFFERLAQVAPVVILVEDAQHADVGLLEFLDHLVDWTREVPVFVLVFAREGISEVKPGFGMGRNRSMLSLDPLDAESMEGLVEGLVPGMPPWARHEIVQRAEGVPLFAVETVRSLVDRGVVVEEEGAYRLLGELGELVVPDTLHALLAARLDALDPDTRALVGVASVLGTSFSADALISVSGREPLRAQEGLNELVRRDVLEISADPLSPERGSYRFVQEMLRQVAYETLSRRDRKSRHLAMAAHLREAFANDGEEIADVIARHYLDALALGTDEADAGAIREESLGMLVRAAERAERGGAPGRAAASYGSAATLLSGGEPGELAEHGEAGSSAQRARAAMLWERAARAAVAEADCDHAVRHAEAARQCYTDLGDVRGAARARTVAGQALRQAGRLTDARAQLSEAVAALRAEPDVDTVAALGELARADAFVAESGERLSAEALALGQAIDVDPGPMASLLIVRGTVHAAACRMAQAAAYLEKAARLAESAGDAAALSRALINLSDALGGFDPKGAAEAAREAAEHSRRIGNRLLLSISTNNLMNAHLELGAWEEVDSGLLMAGERDGLGEDGSVLFTGGLLASLRGDGEGASAVLESLSGLGASEDAQDQARVATLAAFTSAALGQPADTLAHCRSTLRHTDTLGVRHEFIRWTWPLAARTARGLGDAASTAEFVTLLDAHPIGHLPPLLRAERDLVRAWASADNGNAEAAEAFGRAVDALRTAASPYHLAQGLLDHAEYLAQVGDTGSADDATEEARLIGEQLRCPPVVQRTKAPRAEHADSRA